MDWWGALLIVGMLVSGSVNTISKRAQNKSKARGLDNKRSKFKKPWFQTLIMFLGELVCLFVYLFRRYKFRAGLEATRDSDSASTISTTSSQGFGSSYALRESVSGGLMDPSNMRESLLDGDEEDMKSDADEVEIVSSSGHALDRPFTWRLAFILCLPTIADLIGTTLSGIGLLYVQASVWQMMRGSIIVWSGILSIIFLKRKLYSSHWTGIGIVCTGLVIVGVSSLYAHKETHDDDDDDAVSTGKMFFGFGMILAGQVCNAGQMVIEEKFLKKENLAPTMVVGMEGLWGATFMTFAILPLLYVIPGDDEGSVENFREAFLQISRNSGLLIFILLYFLSIAFYNFFGLSMAKKLSSVHRALIDALRTIVVWGVELFIHYAIDDDFGEEWTKWSFLQMAGFVFLFVGTLVYNGIIKLDFLNYAPEKGKELANEEEMERSDYVGVIGSINSGAGPVDISDHSDISPQFGSINSPRSQDVVTSLNMPYPQNSGNFVGLEDDADGSYEPMGPVGSVQASQFVASGNGDATAGVIYDPDEGAEAAADGLDDGDDNMVGDYLGLGGGVV